MKTMLGFLLAVVVFAGGVNLMRGGHVLPCEATAGLIERTLAESYARATPADRQSFGLATAVMTGLAATARHQGHPLKCQQFNLGLGL